MALLSLSLSGCPKVEIKDSEWCGSLASKGAACFHTLTEERRWLNLQEFAEWWNDLSNPKICSTVSTFADIKASLEELCSLNNVCTYEQKQQIQKIADKLNLVIGVAKKVK